MSHIEHQNIIFFKNKVRQKLDELTQLYSSIDHNIKCYPPYFYIVSDALEELEDFFLELEDTYFDTAFYYVIVQESSVLYSFFQHKKKPFNARVPITIKLHKRTLCSFMTSQHLDQFCFYLPYISTTIPDTGKLETCVNISASNFSSQNATRIATPNTVPNSQSNLENNSQDSFTPNQHHPLTLELHPLAFLYFNDDVLKTKVIETFNCNVDTKLSSKYDRPWYRPSWHDNLYKNVYKKETTVSTSSVLSHRLRYLRNCKISIIGAGLAGTSLAYSLSQRGLKSTLYEAHSEIASEASGNRQGLLYAKIVDENTTQTQLLIQSYVYAYNEFKKLLLKEKDYGESGIIHFNYDKNETSRHNKLLFDDVRKFSNFYDHISSEGIFTKSHQNIHADGLYWPYGMWISPRACAQSLLTQSNSEICFNKKLVQLQYSQESKKWLLDFDDGTREQSDVVILTLGAQQNNFFKTCGVGINPIRGQTSLMDAHLLRNSLSCALSAQSYISPQKNNIYCFGATFYPSNNECTPTEKDNDTNLHNLISLLGLSSFKSEYQNIDVIKRHVKTGHCALRADAFDHLPIVGEVGNYILMKKQYRHLSKDKNWNYQSSCPYYPNLYINTAHGSRGLSTILLSSEALVCDILGLPSPYPNELKAQLHPNRVIIRNIVSNQYKSSD